VAEGGGLLNRYTVISRIEGSNPSVSASYKVMFMFLLRFIASTSFLTRPYPQTDFGTNQA
jgi:hypothetical protein